MRNLQFFLSLITQSCIQWGGIGGIKMQETGDTNCQVVLWLGFRQSVILIEGCQNQLFLFLFYLVELIALNYLKLPYFALLCPTLP